MSCENCAITIDRVIGSPTAYKIKFANYPSTWSEERANNSHDPDFTDVNRGAVIAQNVTDSDLQTTPTGDICGWSRSFSICRFLG